jgi:hypothetical protein
MSGNKYAEGIRGRSGLTSNQGVGIQHARWQNVLGLGLEEAMQFKSFTEVPGMDFGFLILRCCC